MQSKHKYMSKTKQTEWKPLPTPTVLYQKHTYKILKYNDTSLNYVEPNGKKAVYDFHLGFSKHNRHFGTCLRCCYLNTDDLEPLFREFDELVRLDIEDRKQYVLKEREYPKQHTFNFSNVVVRVVEEYENLECKKVYLYFNDRRLHYGMTVKHDYIVTAEDIEYKLNDGVLRPEDSPSTINYYKQKTETNVDKILYPLYEYLNKLIEFKGVEYAVSDVRCYGMYNDANIITLTTNKGDLQVKVSETLLIKVLGDVVGLDSLMGLRNKLKYIW